MTHRVIVLGAGPMGTAIALGLRNSKLDIDLLIAEKNEGRRRRLLNQYGLTSAEQHVVEPGDVVILAIPPQVFQAFSAEQKDTYGDCLIISVMASLQVEIISRTLCASQVVRTIPNTPAEVSQGMTVMFSGPTVTPASAALAEKIMGALGKVILVEDEALIDDATALCGGGPAFVAYYAKAMFDFALDRGFTHDQARMMICQVLRGTAELLDFTKKHPLKICDEVMTPNGTTERGISAYRERAFDDVVIDGLRRSAARSRELTHVTSCGARL